MIKAKGKMTEEEIKECLSTGAKPPYGAVFGKWTVDYEHFPDANFDYCPCTCSCGVDKLIYKADLLEWKTTQCLACDIKDLEERVCRLERNDE